MQVRHVVMLIGNTSIPISRSSMRLQLGIPIGSHVFSHMSRALCQSAAGNAVGIRYYLCLSTYPQDPSWSIHRHRDIIQVCISTVGIGIIYSPLEYPEKVL